VALIPSRLTRAIALALCVCLIVSGCGDKRSLLSISDDSLLDVATKIFVHDSGATALGVMNYDYTQGAVTVGYLSLIHI
jgi:hypothetical protein